MIDDFLMRTLIAGIGMVGITAPLGSYMIWRRLAFLADTIAHASLLGVVLSLCCSFSSHLGIFIAALSTGIFLFPTRKWRFIGQDTWLAIFSQGALALGLLGFSFVQKPNTLLTEYLFGDLLALDQGDVFWILAGFIVTAVSFAWHWRSIISISLNEDLAAIEGVPVRRIQTYFSLLLSFGIAILLKSVGILLLSALLIIPCSTARLFSKSPESMVCYAGLFALLSYWGGIGISYYFETPTSPTIVALNIALFITALGIKRKGCA